MTRRTPRSSHQDHGDPDRTVYIRGEDPREFGRQVARDVFKRHVMPLIEEAEERIKN